MVQSQYNIRTDILVKKLLYPLRLFDKKYSHMVYHTKISAEPSTVRGKVPGYREDVQILIAH